MTSKLFTTAFITICMLLPYACTNTKPATNKQQWTFELDTGGCMDVCKAYTISIKSNGTFDYKGTFNVKHKGTKSGQITEKDLAGIDALIKAVQWKELESSYGKAQTPRKEMTYTSDLLNKTIVYSQLEPLEIRKIEIFINDLIDQDDF